MSFRTRGGNYDNSSNRTKNRMDMRIQSDPATQAGVRNAHRDTRGNIIGGQDLYGRNFGTNANAGSGFRGRSGLGGSTVDGSRLGNPSTPGLDLNRQMNPNPPVTDTAPGYAMRKMRGQTAAAADGSQLLKDRQALHAEMQTAGAGGLSPDMEARAKKLGVTGSSFRRVAGSLPKAPAMVASTPPRPSPLRMPVTPPVTDPPVQPAQTLVQSPLPPTNFKPGSTLPSGMANDPVTRSASTTPAPVVPTQPSQPVNYPVQRDGTLPTKKKPGALSSVFRTRI